MILRVANRQTAAAHEYLESGRQIMKEGQLLPQRLIVPPLNGQGSLGQGTHANIAGEKLAYPVFSTDSYEPCRGNNKSFDIAGIELV